jgi:hypothetical protein
MRTTTMLLLAALPLCPGCGGKISTQDESIGQYLARCGNEGGLQRLDDFDCGAGSRDGSDAGAPDPAVGGE